MTCEQCQDIISVEQLLRAIPMVCIGVLPCRQTESQRKEREDQGFDPNFFDQYGLVRRVTSDWRAYSIMTPLHCEGDGTDAFLPGETVTKLVSFAKSRQANQEYGGSRVKYTLIG